VVFILDSSIIIDLGWINLFNKTTMKTRVRPNSIEAFQELNLGKRQEQVLRVIKETGNITAKGIAFALKLKINQVTGRITELLHKQLIKIEKIGIDSAGANHRVNYYSVRKETDPKNVFDLSWEDKFNILERWLKENYPATLHEFECVVKHEL